MENRTHTHRTRRQDEPGGKLTLYRRRTVGEMPSLQQTSFKDWPSPDIARSLTGPDILQKHSINSLLLEHNEIISRGLPSPIEENVSFSELLGSSQSSQSTSTSSLLGTSGHHGHHHHHQHKYGTGSSVGGSGTGICPDSSAASSILSSTGSGPNSASSPSVLSSSTSNPFCFTGLSMSSSSLNSPELGGGTGGTGGGGGGSGSNGNGGGQSPTYYGSGGTGGLHKSSFDDFRFDSDLGLSTGTSNNGSSNLTSETLKLFQRNMASSYQDCSPLPTSPSSSSSTNAAAALCARYFRGGSSQQHDLNHNGYDPSSSSSLFSNTTTATAAANQSASSSSLSRSNSPPDHDATSLLTNFDSTNILDMISYLTISQHQQQQQQNGQHHYSNSSNGGGSSHYGQSSTSSSSLNSFYQHQQQQQQGGGSSYGSGNGMGQGNGNSIGGGFTSNDYERLQNLQALNTLRLLQQSQYQLQQQYQQQFNQLMPGGYGSSQLKNWPSQNSPPSSTSSSGSCNGGGGGGGGSNDINLDRIARFHRSSAAHYDATCTWSGVLPPRSHRLVTYSSKIFLGGMPWDISEQSLVQIFKPFGSIKVEWPGKEQQATQPKGYVYIIFESDKQVKALLQACTYSDANGYGGSSSRGGPGGGGNGSGGMMSSSCGSDDMQLVPLSPGAMANKQQPISMANARINFKISSKRIKSKDVEVIPWNIADSNYVKSTSQKLDPTKTVFVGALHGQLTAEGLAKIMNDLFDGVVYVGIDTDKYKYPLGSARVTFNNSRSYMKAVVAAFIEIKTAKFTKKLQVDPYLEDSLCSMCGVQHGPYFCREIVCFRYFCRSCWQFQHNRDVSLQNHKPLTRNSKSTTIVGVGPQQQHQQQPQPQQSPPSSMDSGAGALHRRQQLLYHHHMSQQQQQQQQSSPTSSDVHRRLYNVGHLQDLSSSSSLSLPQSPSPSCTTSSSSGGSSADSSPVNCHGPANLHQQLQQQFGAGGL